MKTKEPIDCILSGRSIFENKHAIYNNISNMASQKLCQVEEPGLNDNEDDNRAKTPLVENFDYMHSLNRSLQQNAGADDSTI